MAVIKISDTPMPLPAVIRVNGKTFRVKKEKK